MRHILSAVLFGIGVAILTPNGVTVLSAVGILAIVCGTLLESL